MREQTRSEKAIQFISIGGPGARKLLPQDTLRPYVTMSTLHKYSKWLIMIDNKDIHYIPESQHLHLVSKEKNNCHSQ
jgi:hypothetical protein